MYMKGNDSDELLRPSAKLKCSSPIELEEESNTRLSSPNSHYELDVDNKSIQLNTKRKYTPRVTETRYVALKQSNEFNILPNASTNKCKLHYDLPNSRVEKNDTIERGNPMNHIENKGSNIIISITSL